MSYGEEMPLELVYRDAVADESADEEEDVDDEEVANDFYDLEELDCLAEQDDGSLGPLENLEIILIEDEPYGNDENGGTVDLTEDSTAVTRADDERMSSSTGQEDGAWPTMECAIPMISSGTSQDEDAQQTKACACPGPISQPGHPSRGVAVGRARTGRGRSRGRRGGGGARVGIARSGQWSRGQPLVEKFRHDDDMPRDLQQEFNRLDASRGSQVVAREADRDEHENDEDEFNDCQGFRWLPMEGWQGVKETYRPRRPTGPTDSYSSPYDALRAFWDDAIVNAIVTETNRYAAGISGDSFKREWVDTNLDEIWCLFGFWMMLGIINMPSIKACFSSAHLLYTTGFRSLFTERRYWKLNRAFHLSAAAYPEDPLSPMGPVLDHLNARFQERYEPEQNICIDESLTLWKGPGSFTQYINTKSARFGIKTFELCESSTGYMCSFFVYVGRRTTSSPLPCSASTVLKLVKPRLDLGHVLYMDNWFNSPQLARYLKRRRTDCVGTLRADRKNVPAIIQRAALVEGEFVARQSGDVTVVTFADRKQVSVLSTCHGTEQVRAGAKPGRPAFFRLRLVADYNAGMGGVDRMEQMLEPYLVERKQCRKWTKKLFKRFLNISIQNARILFEKSSGRKVDSLAFRLALVQSILERHRPRVPAARQRGAPRPASCATVPGVGSCACSCANGSNTKPARLTERHFITRIPVTEEDRRRIKYRQNQGRGYCVWCKWCTRKSKTYYHCAACDVPLCGQDKDCFIKYHTLEAPLEAKKAKTGLEGAKKIKKEPV